MKLLRVGAPGEERPAGRTDDGRPPDPSSVAVDVDGVFRHTPLEPGDVINTGTSAGVALGLPGTPCPGPGDTVEPESDGLGSRRRTFGPT